MTSGIDSMIAEHSDFVSWLFVGALGVLWYYIKRDQDRRDKRDEENSLEHQNIREEAIERERKLDDARESRDKEFLRELQVMRKEFGLLHEKSNKNTEDIAYIRGAHNERMCQLTKKP
jgi:hypothetical protein